jgi:hypothetical protein
MIYKSLHRKLKSEKQNATNKKNPKKTKTKKNQGVNSKTPYASYYPFGIFKLFMIDTWSLW